VTAPSARPGVSGADEAHAPLGSDQGVSTAEERDTASLPAVHRSLTSDLPVAPARPPWIARQPAPADSGPAGDRSPDGAPGRPGRPMPSSARRAGATPVAARALLGSLVIQRATGRQRAAGTPVGDAGWTPIAARATGSRADLVGGVLAAPTAGASGAVD